MEFFKFERIPGTDLYRLYVDGRQAEGQQKGGAWTMTEILDWLENEYQRESLPRSDR